MGFDFHGTDPDRFKITVTRDEQDRVVIDAPSPDTTPSTEAAERPPMPDAGLRYFDQHGSDQAG